MAMGPTRLVEANRIVSPALPSVEITIDPAFTYVGGPSFHLYGIAHAEQHLFVVADERRRIRRLVWVQVKGYLPDNQRTYRYPVTQTVDLGGVPFIYDTSTAAIGPAIAERPDSDLAAAANHLRAHGYEMSDDVASQRFVHLIEPDNRNELMIIYGESGDEAESVHPKTARERALASFSVRFT